VCVNQEILTFAGLLNRQATTSKAMEAPFDQWGRFLPENTTAVSLLDRLLHHANVEATSGDSYRMRQARASTTGTATWPLTARQSL
jgi:DNA replication protein DnaC